MATLAALTFASSMLLANRGSHISADQFKARMCAESGLQVVRLFVAQPEVMRLDLGGSWQNDMFYARNVIPGLDPAQRGNFTMIAPALDTVGNYSGVRFGLQNESAKLNLNALAQLDALASAGDIGGATGGDATSTALLASAASSGLTSTLAADMLLALPGMTEDVADCILDWLDEDDEPRTYGAEYDYYASLQTPYEPTNGPITSVEQLLLVKGVTAQMLFGFDVDRNGILDDQEQAQMSLGAAPGSNGIVTGVSADPNVSAPPALGWSAYLTLHSLEKNVNRNGEVRININGDDLQVLYDELMTVLGDETAASFIVAYRQFGAPGGGGVSPLVTLAAMAAEESGAGDTIGDTLAGAAALSSAANNTGGAPALPWSADLIGSIDMTQPGNVKFNQVLDLFDATVTIQSGNASQVYSSPYIGLPASLVLATPLLMDNLTTVDAAAIPGRINIMTCPQEVLRGIPGLSDEIVDQILQARVDGSESETRNFETWLAAESLITMEQMRAILPLVTCGGDVFKAQIVGYMEGSNSSSRIEAIVSGGGDLPEVLFFRRLGKFGRGADIQTLGQRFDATITGGMLQ